MESLPSAKETKDIVQQAAFVKKAVKHKTAEQCLIFVGMDEEQAKNKTMQKRVMRCYNEMMRSNQEDTANKWW